MWDGKRTTSTIVGLCSSLYNWLDNTTLLIDPWSVDLEDHIDEIEQWIETQSYYSNRPRTRVKTFIEEAKEWWSIYVRKGEKEIITSIEELETELICESLKSNSELSWLWQGEFQKPFYWIEEGISCKGLGDICLDKVYVDLKYTTYDNLNDWWKVCANFNYPFQMAYYKSGLQVDRCYWLVVNKNWYELIPVSELMLQIGKWGIKKQEKLMVGKVEFETEKKIYGYMDGLNLLNGFSNERSNDEQFLNNLF